MDPSFIPSYCPKKITEGIDEEVLTKEYSNKSETKIMDCLGLLTDAEDCQTEPGNDYVNVKRKAEFII